MTDPLTQLRDALETSKVASEHALVPRALLRELLARLEAAEAVVEAAQEAVTADDCRSVARTMKMEARFSEERDAALSKVATALFAHAKLKDAP